MLAARDNSMNCGERLQHLLADFALFSEICDLAHFALDRQPGGAVRSAWPNPQVAGLGNGRQNGHGPKPQSHQRRAVYPTFRTIF